MYTAASGGYGVFISNIRGYEDKYMYTAASGGYGVFISNIRGSEDKYMYTAAFGGYGVLETNKRIRIQIHLNGRLRRLWRLEFI